MINPFNRLLDRQEQQAGGADLLLATVAAVTSGGLTLILDGETEATRKKYKYMTSAYPVPAAGDRVVVMRLSGTYVVLGRIGASTPAADQYVRRSGDTMTGGLKIISSILAMIANSITLGTRPESNKWSAAFTFLDSAEKQIGRIMAHHGTNGYAGLQIYGEQPINGTTKYNYLGLYMSDEGAGVVDMNYPAAWRKALGLELDTTPTAGSANVVTSGGIKTALDGKVSKAGDTMTGDLHMLNAAPYIDSDEITIGTRPESNKWSKRIAFRDSARKTFARAQGFQGANGNIGIQLIGEQTVNGENKTNYLGLYVSDTGASVVDISSAAWRKALGLGDTNGALPLTIAQGGSGDTQTVRETTIANVATAGANVTLTQTLFCRWGKLAMIEIMGKATADIAAGSTVFTLVAGKRPALDSSAQVWRSTTYVSTIHPDGTAVLVGGTLSSGSGFTILACYLLA